MRTPLTLPSFVFVLVSLKEPIELLSSRREFCAAKVALFRLFVRLRLCRSNSNNNSNNNPKSIPTLTTVLLAGNPDKQVASGALVDFYLMDSALPLRRFARKDLEQGALISPGGVLFAQVRRPRRRYIERLGVIRALYKKQVFPRQTNGWRLARTTTELYWRR